MSQDGDSQVFQERHDAAPEVFQAPPQARPCFQDSLVNEQQELISDVGRDRLGAVPEAVSHRQVHGEVVVPQPSAAQRAQLDGTSPRGGGGGGSKEKQSVEIIVFIRIQAIMGEKNIIINKVREGLLHA